MSVTSSTPCIKIPNPSTSSCYRFATSSKLHIVTIRSSKAEGPIRRPVAPPIGEQPLKPIPPSSPSTLPSSNVAPVVVPPPKPVSEEKSVITLEFQRQKAKELQEYFKQKKVEEANQGPFFGFLGKNEIINGRWAMFGFAVGMLTEYATGADFVDQVKILLSNFGIIDLE